jgi:hypothetical protein
MNAFIVLFTSEKTTGVGFTVPSSIQSDNRVHEEGTFLIFNSKKEEKKMEKHQDGIKTPLNKIDINFRMHCQQAKFSIIRRSNK